ncbi:hypothetical protein RGB74_16835 [Bacillus sp. NEB1478]|nr:hypothetical protein [Bacillus sp. NEB1478]WNB94030.1 hypothetical protein RGB74_16835 [Bacillus sp. NEB1478]
MGLAGLLGRRRDDRKD